VRREHQHSYFLDDIFSKLPASWKRVDTTGIDQTPDLVFHGPSGTIYGVEWKAGKGPLHFGAASAIEPSLSQLAQWRELNDRDPVLIFVTSQDFSERLLASVASLRFVLVEYEMEQPTAVITKMVADTITAIEAGQSDRGQMELLCDPDSNFWRRRSRGHDLVALHNAAIVSAIVENYDQAQDLLAKILSEQVNVLGAGNPNVASTEIELARVGVRAGSRGAADRLAQLLPGRASADFRDREMELEQILTNLKDVDGEHFWLVTAPPALGKSWLLRKIDDLVHMQMPGRWVSRKVDLRDWPDSSVPDAAELIGAMFGQRLGMLEPIPADDLAKVADDLIMASEYHLCLIDSAEILSEDTVRELRSYLAHIHADLEAAGSPRARLALIVASRTGTGWLGVMPRPRLQIIRLTEFTHEVVRDALAELDWKTSRSMSPAELRDLAERVHQVSEGLPVLLVNYLNWIEERHWSDLHPLADQETFIELARPYIENALLSRSSLLGYTEHPTADQRVAIEMALRSVVPYRLITASHLAHHAAGGPLRTAMDAAGWPVEQLWAAVINTDLLNRPSQVPWHSIDAPIRRLLFRYWYPTAELRRQAHQEAGGFLRLLAAELTGSDQAHLLLECLWHEANALTGSGQDVVRQDLVQLAQQLSSGLVGSFALSDQNVRDVAVDLVAQDAELAGVLSAIDGGLAAVRSAILSPSH
jgi:hypothetical protein